MTTIDLARVTKTLSPAQIRSIVQATARINLWTGSIRAGKTFASLLAFLIDLATVPTGGQIVIIGRTKDTIARNVFAELSRRELFGALADEVHYTVGATTAVILGQTVHLIGAADARAEGKLRGMTVVRAYVDEATLLPRDFWVQLLGRMSPPDAKLWATTNPDNPAHWLRRDFMLRGDRGELDMRHWRFSLLDNPSLTEKYRRDISAEFTGLFYRRFILGHWVAAEGAIFDNFDLRRHVVPDARVPLITRWLSLGVDYGTTNPFAAELIGVGADRRLYVVSEFWYDSRIRRRSKTDAEYSADLFAWLDDVRIPQTDIRGVRADWTCVDPSAASFIAQLWRDGITPTPADNSVVDGIRNVSSLITRDRFRVAKSCRYLIDEFPGYSWSDEHALKGEDVPIKVDDHALDAVRYGIQTTEVVWRQLLEQPILALAR